MSFFSKLDPVIKRDIKYIAIVVLILTVLMESVFLIIGKWDLTVLFGGMLGAATAMINFTLMAVTIQNSLGKEEKDAKGAMKVSHSMRMLMLVVICAIAALLPKVFNLVATIIPLLFPSIGARLHGQFVKNN